MTTQRVFRTAVLPFAVAILLAACSTGGASTAPAATELLPGGGPGIGGGAPTIPQPGQLDVRPIAADTLEAQVNGRRVVVTVHFTSGVEPCHVLDSVLVAKAPGSFAITLREGTGPGDVVCIQIAELKRVQVDLGELEPDTYTITDTTGGAAAIQVVVS